LVARDRRGDLYISYQQLECNQTMNPEQAPPALLRVHPVETAVPAARTGIRVPAPAKIPLVTRILEVCVAATALIVLSPLMLWIAWVIRRGTPGRALFRQQRVGQGLRLFTFYKFRTMYDDARERFADLYEYDYSPEEVRTLQFKVEEDPRVTPQGKWLRYSTLDELPNLWNVLKGEMALVGPRPEIPEMLPYYPGDLAMKFSVRPGITGLAQISGRGRLKFMETLAYDLEYVRNRSLLLDLQILAITVAKLLKCDGAF
jgi:lipopolysaccharide/colanic/teichoic acid biosynthesis glycosyltransferase